MLGGGGVRRGFHRYVNRGRCRLGRRDRLGSWCRCRLRRRGWSGLRGRWGDHGGRVDRVQIRHRLLHGRYRGVQLGGRASVDVELVDGGVQGCQVGGNPTGGGLHGGGQVGECLGEIGHDRFHFGSSDKAGMPDGTDQRAGEDVIEAFVYVGDLELAPEPHERTLPDTPLPNRNCRGV